ncbi:MAG: biotin transporter BioY [Treponema sp.]|nr:biotin transporter BioY [Treponema sp.]
MEAAKKTKLARSAFTALFALLICIDGLICIPFPAGIPLKTQDMFAALSGLILGGLQGAGAVGLFLVAGAAGLPVFERGQGGFDVIQGSGGGYLIGYFLGALIGGLIIGSPLKNEKKSTAFIIRAAVATLIAFITPFLTSIPWFIAYMQANGKQTTFQQVLSASFFPFIAGSLVKMLISLILALTLRPVVARWLYPDDEKEAEEIIKKLERRKGKSGI